MTELIANPQKLMKRVLDRQDEDRRFLGRLQRRHVNELGDAIKKDHQSRVASLTARHLAEREVLARQQKMYGSRRASFAPATGSAPDLSFEAAPPRPFKRGPTSDRLSERFKAEAETPAPDAAHSFKEAARPQRLSRAEQIPRDMEEWRKRNKDRDQGREL